MATLRKTLLLDSIYLYRFVLGYFTISSIIRCNQKYLQAYLLAMPEKGCVVNLLDAKFIVLLFR